MIVLPSSYRHLPRFTVSFCFSMAYSTALSEILWSCRKVESGTNVAGRGFLAFVLRFPRFLAVGLGGAAVGDEGAEAAGAAVLARGVGACGRSCGGADARARCSSASRWSRRASSWSKRWVSCCSSVKSRSLSVAKCSFTAARILVADDSGFRSGSGRCKSISRFFAIEMSCSSVTYFRRGSAGSICFDASIPSSASHLRKVLELVCNSVMHWVKVNRRLITLFHSY